MSKNQKKDENHQIVILKIFHNNVIKDENHQKNDVNKDAPNPI